MLEFGLQVVVCFSKKMRVLLNGTKIQQKDDRFKSMAKLKEKFNSNAISPSSKTTLETKRKLNSNRAGSKSNFKLKQKFDSKAVSVGPKTMFESNAEI